MQTVFYYTSTYFLDISLEIINVLKKCTHLHVFIEITPNSKNANIVDIASLPHNKYLATPLEILAPKDLAQIAPYFDGTESVQFIIHQKIQGGLGTYRSLKPLYLLAKKYQPTVLHFEGFTMRTLGLVPLIIRIKKTVLTVHDAVLHSGENNWKSKLPRTIFFKLPVNKSYLFYSQFSKDQFIKNTPHSPGSMSVLKMNAFSYYRRLSLHKNSQSCYLLFFGRISKYKGVNILLDAMANVWQKFPEEKLWLAGKGADEELLEHEVLKENKKNINFLNRYIPNDELVAIIKNAKMVICPYLDASQSGVLMTSFALNKPVLATDTGAFQEFIKPGINGYLVTKNNATALAEKICECLTNDHYRSLEKNLVTKNSDAAWSENEKVLLNAYANLTGFENL